MSASPRVAVIGGGLAGLTVARQLNIRSPAPTVDVEVFEAAEAPGGVIGTSVADGFIRESAANGVLGSAKGGGAELAADLGIEMVPASHIAKNRWIFVDGRLQALPSNPIALAKSALLSPRGKLRLLAEPVRGALPGEPTVAEFFSHRLGDEVHDRIVAPFVSGIYAGDTRELSMLASFPRVSEIASHGGLLRGLIGERFGGRGAKKAAGGRRTSAPAGGMGEIIDRLAEKLAGRIRFAERIERIERSTRGVELVSASGRVEHFDAVVCAVPAHAAATMFRAADRELAELLVAIPTAPVAVVHLGYRRQDVGHPLDGFGFLAAPCEDLDVLGVVFESSIWPNRAPDGAVLLRCMIGGRRRPELVDQSSEDIVGIARQSCAEILQVRGEPVHENLVRWPRAIAQYTVGHRERLERAEVLAADQGVVLAGASYHGVAVNSVTADAARVARRIHELLAAPLTIVLWFLVAFLVASALAACSGAGKTKPVGSNGDGGQDAQPTQSDDDAQAISAAPRSAFNGGYSIIAVDAASSGTIEISVIAPTPPATAIATSGVTACNKPRRGQLVVHTLGGVVGAVAWLEDIERGRAETTQKGAVTMRLDDCRVNPRVSVVGRLDSSALVVTSDRVARELEVSLAQGETKSTVARLPMTPIGRGFDVPLNSAGVYRTGTDGIDEGWIVVTGTPYIVKTGEKGKARMTGVPPGSYSLRVWHSPVAGKSMSAVESITVEAGKVAPVTIDFSSQLAATQ